MVLINITLFLGDDDCRYTQGGKSKRNNTEQLLASDWDGSDEYERRNDGIAIQQSELLENTTTAPDRATQ